MDITPHQYIPVEIVFHPNWWHHETGMTFDRGYFFDPERRVEDEMKMRRTLWERFGEFGYGEEHPEPEPVVGPVHLAAGYMFSSLWGCTVEFHEDSSPQVLPRNMSAEELDAMDMPDPADNDLFRDWYALVEALESKFGSVTGDINWTGLQNLALDLLGQNLFIDYYDKPETIRRILDKITGSFLDFLPDIKKKTGTTSISVNRSIVGIDPAINIHSNCSVQMISNGIYESFLLEFENTLSKHLQPYGIHHCGNNMHNVAEGYSKVDDCVFFDVGWGADIAYCREKLPDAFFNVRLSPVKIRECTPDEVEEDIVGLFEDAGDLAKVGLCCINMDHGTPDENVIRIFEVAERYRNAGA